MVWLKNVKRENNIISADYHPEGSEEFTRIEYDCRTGEGKGVLVGFKHETRSHLAHAWYALEEIANGKRPMQENVLVMWY